MRQDSTESGGNSNPGGVYPTVSLGTNAPEPEDPQGSNRQAEGREMASAPLDAPGERKSPQQKGKDTGAALRKNLDTKVLPPSYLLYYSLWIAEDLVWCAWATYLGKCGGIGSILWR